MTTAPTAHPDFASEQEFLRHAYECLKTMRQRRLAQGDAGGDPKASTALERLRTKTIERLGDPESICFGRIDLTEGAKHYVGRQAIWDDGGGDPVVINWQAPAAEPFYTATPLEPAGLTLRRRFRTERQKLLDIADEPFGTAPSAEPTVGDILLDELGRERTAEMRDIVATIQQDQYRIISRPIDVATVVQGGPGTGKTAVGLHRAAWLIYRHREALTAARVLIVGPNPLFMQYIQYVLPSLGETAADQSVIDGLGAVSAARVDDNLVAKVKGDERMAEVLRRAVVDRVRTPSEDVAFEANRIRFEIPVAAIEDLLEGFDPVSQAYQTGRDRFRASFERRVEEAYAVAAAQQRAFPGPPPPVEVRALRDFDRALDRIWPAVTAPEIVRQLLASEERLERAGADALTETERRLLYRKPVERLDDVRWSTSDIPLIDEAQYLLDHRPQRYGHVILDEAQDLTPMQLRMVGRRIREGSATVLGDLAQATGLWTYGSWDEVAMHLGIAETAEIEELTIAYRVPREIMDVALPVLELTAPSIRPPVSYREGGEAPTWVETSRHGRVGQAVDRATAAHTGGGTAAIIAPVSLLSELGLELQSRKLAFGDARQGELAASIELIDPPNAKGLEFDHVVLVEPAAIIRESAQNQGHRELYVALTRATRSLVGIHSEPLPWPLGSLTEAASHVIKRIASERSEESAQPVEMLKEGLAVSVSLSEAVVLARVNGIGLQEGLARALLAGAAGADEHHMAAALLQSDSEAAAVSALLAEARKLASDDA